MWELGLKVEQSVGNTINKPKDGEKTPSYEKVFTLTSFIRALALSVKILKNT
jgi:hypothetical protein